MIRAGRYIREFIEPEVKFAPTWEAWLAEHPELRLVDKHFSSCFIVLFFLYYFMAIAFAMQRLIDDATVRVSGSGWYWVAAAGSVYTILTLWGISTLLRHWRSLVAPPRAKA